VIGLILRYSNLTKIGIIIDEHSDCYQFSDDLWLEDTTLQCGMKIYFDLNLANKITKIYKENKGG
jgi:hypothetical protein